MVDDVEVMNFRKLKCNNYKVSFCFKEELPTKYKTKFVLIIFHEPHLWQFKSASSRAARVSSQVVWPVDIC